MTADEVISQSKLLSKALVVGSLVRYPGGIYRVMPNRVYLTEYDGKTWCYKKENWVAITSVEQVEAVFKRTVRDGE